MPPSRLHYSHRPISKAALRTTWGRCKHAITLAAMHAADHDLEAELQMFILSALAHHKGWKSRDLHEGPQGPYTAPRVDEFFHLLIHEYTERRFKRWLR
jgi:hypothetical protein